MTEIQLNGEVPLMTFEPRLAELEAIVERGLATFIEVGNALLEIRDSRLYRQTHETFETYCRERWSISRQRAHQLIDASEVARNLSTIVDVAPTHESQVRPLAGLAPEQQREAWKIATEATPKPTAEFVLKIAETIKRGPSLEQKDFDAVVKEEREKQYRATTTRLFEHALVFFTPQANTAQQTAENLLEKIDPELITPGWLTHENLTGALEVFSVIATQLKIGNK